MVNTVLSHIAHLVDAVAQVLHVVLPHPLHPFEAVEGSLVSPQLDLHAQTQHGPSVSGSSSSHSHSHSLAPATHMHDRACFSDFNWTSVHELSDFSSFTCSSTSHLDPPPRGQGSSSDSTARSQSNALRWHEAAVVLKTEESGRILQYALNSTFGTALTLLQADIVVLCLSAGVPAEQLWPPEAMLFNLHLLQEHCKSVVQRGEQGGLCLRTSDNLDKGNIPADYRVTESKPELQTFNRRYGRDKAYECSTSWTSAGRGSLPAYVMGVDAEDTDWDVIPHSTAVGTTAGAHLAQTQLL